MLKHRLREGEDALIQKPFAPEVLARKVREAMGPAPSVV